jgi:exopolyphosphatase/pppGpp-phosphohydrolase
VKHGRLSPELRAIVRKEAAGSGVREQYSVLRSGVPDHVPVAVLHIGAEQTAVVAGSGSRPEMLMLEIGSRKTAADFFRHEPPTPGEMENAIAAVEDEVTRARAMIPPGSMLFTTDAAIREITLVAGVADGPELRLSIAAMEQTFERLAAIALRRPAGWEGIPAGHAFAATLLILREFMHHLQFPSITVKI